MTDEELLIWLRVEDTNLTDFAAARIEALTKERDQWISHAKTAIWSDSEELKETERKLAKAVDALEYYAVDALPWEADDSLRARTTLAEIKGGNDAKSDL